MTLQLDPRKTALVLIDMQQGTLAFPLAPYDRTTLIANTAALGQAFAKACGLIATVRVAFAPDRSDLPPQTIDQPMMLPQGGFPADWSELTPEIAALPAAVSVTKRHWSAFYGTELDLQLRRRRIETVVIGGIATNFGVESTARDAWQHGYDVIVAEDASSSVGANLHAFAIASTLPRVSRVRRIAEIAAAITQAA
ncbi:MAG: isochorismatase family protein [Bosea sp.]|uniref:isochorismatase family protein n=1 Tax=Bosea sp. (in: a-proteobacteria) TaxID=1871050 RepID=UPI00238B9D98|nr:isochorismatase family protein [Bosea sp. (in: a-proteobacteria)]MCP4740074.1 isochorismatase family protein [Bosea sp. (in: a-proteobacteria)]